MADRNIVIFGAGKIGRSFIGQLFGKAGYEVVFVDMDRSLVRELNRRREYNVVIKGPDLEERLVIKNVSAIHAEERNAVINAIGNADIMAVSVGKTALPAIASAVAEGLMEREKQSQGRILDIILAENMRSAADFFREKLRQALPPSYPLYDQVGLVETSIGKMVPIMTVRDLQEDPLQVFAEPYNTLILDKKGFKGGIPDIKEFALKENMSAWVDRKAFIHNLGHATAAYYGYLKYPGARFIYEVLADQDIYLFTHDVMQEAAQVLSATYQDEFSMDGLTHHIDDLLTRFQNRSLGDTVFRVGHDLQRKLGKDDRFLGIIRMAMRANKPYGMILDAMTMGFCFRAGDERGEMFPGDMEFHLAWKQDPDSMLNKVCGLTIKDDATLIQRLKQHYKRIIAD